MRTAFIYLSIVCFVPGTEVCQIPSQRFFITISGHQPHKTASKQMWTLSSLITHDKVKLCGQSCIFFLSPGPWKVCLIKGENLAELLGADTHPLAGSN